MERGTTKDRLRAAAALAVAAAGLSCGTGIRDGEGEVFVKQLVVVGSEKSQVVLREATLEVGEGSVPDNTTIVMRRYDQIKHTGAIGPVFEIEVPVPNTFATDPTLHIATSADVSTLPSSKIGFLIPSLTPEQWIPDSHTAIFVCLPGTVCGPVQTDSFVQPDGKPALATTILQFAIVQQCGATTECPYNQACYSRACQECKPTSECNL